MLKAIIFDMNGVIINDERVHQESWRQLSKKYNFHLTEENFKQNVFGRTEKDILNYLFGRKVTNDELVRYSNERVNIAINTFKPKMVLAEGLKAFCESLKNNNILLAVATSSRKTYTNFILDGFSIRNLFKKIVTAENINKGKPNPEIYLLTAKEMNVKPEECLVFEDSISGIKAAKAAGMKVVAITTTHKIDELSNADKIIDNFNDLSLHELKELFN